MAGNYSRRDLFSMFRRSLRAADTKPDVRRPQGAVTRMRPPGAIEESRFSDTCLRCTACMLACPRQAIKPLGPEFGPRAGTPHIVAREAPCVLCEGLLCTHMCPSGALTPLLQVAQVQMGLAEVDAQRCLPWHGQACTTCHDRCPVAGAIQVDAQGRPHVTASCTGCGICEYYCPTEPAAIKVRPKTALT